MAAIDRSQVLAYRVAAQGLHRDHTSNTDDDVSGGTDAAGDTWDLEAIRFLDLGVQDTPRGSASQALAARMGRDHPSPTNGAALSLTWSMRGAPHVHRTEDLVGLSRALWPVGDDDALARLDTSASPVRATGMAPREALRMVAEQIADIVTEPMPKGEVSTALTQRVPEEMTVDCRRCKATHIVETLFRSAVLPAGIVFDPNEPIVTFVPIPDWPGVPDEADGVEDLVGAYLYLHGPARARDAATFLGTRAGELTPWWPTDLVEVGYAGRTGWLPADAQALFVDPPDPPRVRLLPPSDPFLQARDRDFVVPEAEHRERLWPILGRPGALLVDGEVAGLWRARKRGRRLEMNVEPFRRLTAAVKRALEDEAQLVATARGTRSAEVTVDTP